MLNAAANDYNDINIKRCARSMDMRPADFSFRMILRQIHTLTKKQSQLFWPAEIKW